MRVLTTMVHGVSPVLPRSFAPFWKKNLKPWKMSSENALKNEQYKEYTSLN